MYKELYEAWRREKESRVLQQLPKDFYGKVADYVKRIREETRMLDNKTVKGRLIKTEFENVKKMIGELLKLRLEKILEKMKLGGEIPKNYLTYEEEKICEKTVPAAEYFQKLTKDIVQGRISEAAGEKEAGKMVVRFLKDVPAIVGVDLKTYGPFQGEDVASLPVENAKILIRQGLAVEVEMG
ncbi:MAG TPA: DNA replication complex GINS family protein [Candidatus Bathyarchaeota archaeon]|nr:DNA replication complex GINS family protein [Candidatus Bathyarchaeota archaeon]HEX69278.1 DNA replication complex GINS family protein [Candidatus Bathyarchaeota archaeon]